MNTSPYSIDANLGAVSLEEALERTKAALKEEGFGVLVELDFKALLREKLDIDFRPYRLLGVCNPPLAHQALQAEKNIGLLLPCPVILQQEDDGTIAVGIGDPSALASLTHNDAVLPIMAQAKERLERALAALA